MSNTTTWQRLADRLSRTLKSENSWEDLTNQILLTIVRSIATFILIPPLLLLVARLPSRVGIPLESHGQFIRIVMFSIIWAAIVFFACPKNWALFLRSLLGAVTTWLFYAAAAPVTFMIAALIWGE